MGPSPCRTRSQERQSEEIKRKNLEIRFMRGEQTDLKHLIDDQKEEINELKDANAELRKQMLEQGKKIAELDELVRKQAKLLETATKGPDDVIDINNLATPETRAAMSAQNEKIQTISKANEELQVEVKLLSKAIEENTQTQDEIKAKNNSIAEELGNTVRRNDFGEHLSHHARRVEEIANMDREIIAFGVEEIEEKDIKTRKINEQTIVGKILKTIDQDWEGQSVELRRIGRFTPGGRPRPLKITLGSNQLATNFIRKAKTLKEHPQFKEIGIRQNLCKSDREILKASVQEMKRLNNERNEEDQQLFFWSIRNLRPKKIWKDQSHTESREIRQTARP